MHFFRVFSKKNKRHAITTVGADMHLSLECVKLIKIIFENIPILHGSGMNTYPLRSKMTHLFAYCHYSRKIWVGVRQWTVGRFRDVVGCGCILMKSPIEGVRLAIPITYQYGYSNC